MESADLLVNDFAWRIFLFQRVVVLNNVDIQYTATKVRNASNGSYNSIEKRSRWEHNADSYENMDGVPIGETSTKRPQLRA